MRQETPVLHSPPGSPTHLPRRRGRDKRCWGSWRRGRLWRPCCSYHLSWVDTPAVGGDSQVNGGHRCCFPAQPCHLRCWRPHFPPLSLRRFFCLSRTLRPASYSKLLLNPQSPTSGVQLYCSLFSSYQCWKHPPGTQDPGLETESQHSI